MASHFALCLVGHQGQSRTILTSLRFDPSLDTEIRTFARNLLKKASETAANRSNDGGVGQYGNYASTSILGEWNTSMSMLANVHCETDEV